MIAQPPPPTLTDLALVGPKTAQKLTRLKITAASDLLFHLPLKYQDYSQPVAVKQVTPNTTVCLKGQITNLYFRPKTIRAKFADSTGSLDLIWFNQPYLRYQIKPKTPITIRGLVSSFNGRLQIVNPSLLPPTSGPIVPVYPQLKDFKSGWSRRLIATNFDRLIEYLPEILPPNLLKLHGLPNLSTALRLVHFPQTIAQAQKGRRRLILNEFLALLAQTHLLDQRQQSIKPTIRLKSSSSVQKKVELLLAGLPYQPTPSQRLAIDQIIKDLTSPRVTNRLLCGDVGSGKSLVFFSACLYTYFSGHSAYIIAPTKILAAQHFLNFQNLFADISLRLVTANSRFKPSSKPTIYIGTQALLKPNSLTPALVIFDEQHRFGVAQRDYFSASGTSPHLITVSATPIPRSLQLTIFEHLKISRIDPRPTQKPAKTFLLTPQKEKDFYPWLSSVVSPHNQAFIVCPHIDISHPDNPVDTALEEFTNFQKSYPRIPSGLIHAGLKPQQIEKVLSDFKAGKILVLIATPIIEVGIDIQNAQIMLIKSAHRYGLSQLHQLRGRVGRGANPGTCFLSSSSQNPSSQKRLDYFCSHKDGFDIARYDLKLRGPGQFLSINQHGFLSSLVAAQSDPQTYLLAQQIFSHIKENHPLLKLLARHPSVNYTILS